MNMGYACLDMYDDNHGNCLTILDADCGAPMPQNVFAEKRRRDRV